MKITHHIPTEQYGFIEIEEEVKGTDELKDLRQTYIQVKKAFEQTGGLDDRTWRKALDGYLGKGDLLGQDYQEMNDFQKAVIQEIKKAFKRLG